DGLPILHDTKGGFTEGSLLKFSDGNEKKAYQSIIDIEPDHHYKWGTINVTANREKEISANVLFGKRPEKGSTPTDYENYDGKKDPLFTDALDLIREIIDKSRHFNLEIKKIFELQMAYMLLWTVLERYTTLRYDLNQTPMERIYQLEDDPNFCKVLKEVVEKKRTVYRSDNPRTRVILDPDKPKNAINYYYQVRSNIVHRGKAIYNDYDILYSSINELLKITEATIMGAFSLSETE
ncbi:uncharacterized protein METZ01_LOCUS487520, partial [marine metagenome]